MSARSRVSGENRGELLADWERHLSHQLVEHKDGCLEWTGLIDRNGIGVVRTPRSLCSVVGALDGMTVVQALWLCRYGRLSAFNLVRFCRSPWCVAPEHRSAATRAHTRALKRERNRAKQAGCVFDRFAFELKLKAAVVRVRAWRERTGVRPPRGKRKPLTAKQRARSRQRSTAHYERNKERLLARYKPGHPFNERRNARRRAMRAEKRAAQAQQGTPP